MDDDLAKVKAG